MPQHLSEQMSTSPSQSQTQAERRWRPGDPTWMTTIEVAAVLGVTGSRVSQLARRGFLPYERTPGGRRVFRPAQVAVIARARRGRFHAEGDG